MGPMAVTPEYFRENIQVAQDMTTAYQSMAKLLNSIYENMFPGASGRARADGHSPIYCVDPIPYFSYHPAYHDIEQPWYAWTHTNSIDEIQDVHTLRCLISKIDGHIDFLSEWGLHVHGRMVDPNEMLGNLRIIRDSCEKRILILNDYLRRGESNRVNYFEIPSIPPVAESSAQGAARGLREAAQAGWSRARREEMLAFQARNLAQEAGYQAAAEARFRIEQTRVEAIQARIMAQEAGHQAAAEARSRIERTEVGSSSSSSYKWKGKGKAI